MGPKRKLPNRPVSHIPDNKKERLCVPQDSSEEINFELDKSPYFEVPNDIKYENTLQSAVTQDMKAGTSQKMAKVHREWNESSFLPESVKNEVEVEGGEAKIGILKAPPPTVFDFISGKMVELVTHLSDDENLRHLSTDAKIKGDGLPFEVLLDDPLTVSRDYKCLIDITPREIKLEPDNPFAVPDDGKVKIKIEPEMSEKPGNTVIDWLCADHIKTEDFEVKDEKFENISMDEKPDDSFMNEIRPLPLERARKPANLLLEEMLTPKSVSSHIIALEVAINRPDAHNSRQTTANGEDDSATDASNMVLDPATGLFTRVPENSHVSQISGHDWAIPSSSSTPQDTDQCHPATNSMITSVENSSLNKPPDNSETPTETHPQELVVVVLAYPFSGGFWTAEQQNEILLQPIPLSMKDVDFNRFPWLCDSPKMKSFYCWPCLLFCPTKPIWSSCLFRNQTFKANLIDHQSTREHLRALMAYYSRKKLAQSCKRSHELEKCRKLWELVVRTICTEKRKKEEFASEGNPQFAADVLIKDTIKTVISKKMSPQTVSQLYDKILSFTTTYLKLEVLAEVKTAHYVTLHVEDLSAAVSGRSWLVVIARYADRNGVIKERVIDFIRSCQATTVRMGSVVAKWLKYLFVEYKLGDNVVGFSYSPSVVVPREIPLFQEAILYYCPRALFFHSPCDNWYRSLLQALSHVPACRRYFQGVQELCEFMTTQRSLIGTVEKSKGYFTPTPLPQTFDDCFVLSLGSYYSTLLKISQRIVTLTLCSPEVERGAKKLVRFLQSPKNRILIVVIGQICSTLAGFVAAIEERVDVNLLMEQRTLSIKILKYLRSSGVLEIQKMTSDPTLSRVVHDVTPTSAKIVDNVIETAIAFLTHRFENSEQFTYTSADSLKSTLKLTKYPTQSQDFIEKAKLNLNETAQLEFLITSPLSPPFVENKDHTELLHFLTQELKTLEYPGLYKYLLLVHTLSPAKTERRQVLDSVHNYVTNTSTDSMDGYFWRIGNASFEKIWKNPEFYLKALQTCQLKYVVENEYDVKLVDYLHFSSW